MGANHTYRYVKTSGLGTLPRKWTGDTFYATVPEATTSGTNKLFLIAYITSNGYNVLAHQNITSDSILSIARNVTVSMIISENILSSTEQVISSCKIPTLYQATYGNIGHYPSDGIIYTVTCTAGIYMPSTSYWTSTYYSNSENGWFVNQGGGVTWLHGSNKISVRTFATIPLS